MSTKKRRALPNENVEAKLDLLKEHFDSHMMKVNNRIENLDDRFDGFEKTFVKQQAILDEHVRRTNLLEERSNEDRKSLEQTLSPIKEKTAEFSLLLRIILALLGATGTGFGIKEILSLISG